MGPCSLRRRKSVGLTLSHDDDDELEGFGEGAIKELNYGEMSEKAV